MSNSNETEGPTPEEMATYRARRHEWYRTAPELILVTEEVNECGMYRSGARSLAAVLTEHAADMVRDATDAGARDQAVWYRGKVVALLKRNERGEPRVFRFDPAGVSCPELPGAEPEPPAPPEPSPASYPALRSVVTGKTLDHTYLEARCEAIKACRFAARQWQRARRRLARYQAAYDRSDAARGVAYDRGYPVFDEAREWELWQEALARIALDAERNLMGCVLVCCRAVRDIHDRPPGIDWPPVGLHIDKVNYVVSAAEDGSGRPVLTVVSFANTDSEEFGLSGGN